MFGGGESRVAELSVDEVLARAHKDLRLRGSTLFDTETSPVGVPSVQVWISGSPYESLRLDSRCKRLSVTTWRRGQTPGQYRAQFEVVYGLLFDIVLQLRSVTQITSGQLDVNAAMMPIPRFFEFGTTPPIENSVLVIVEPKTTFLDRFEDPTVLDRVSFDEKIELDGLLFLARGTHANDTTAMAKDALDDAYELARAARPGTVFFSLPSRAWKPEDFELIEHGERQLEFVGYHPGDKIAEYSCAITDPELHLRPQEVIEAAFCGREKRLPDGRPLERVRVVFLDKDAAYRERRPLLDSLVEVYYLGSTGELVPVTD